MTLIGELITVFMVLWAFGTFVVIVFGQRSFVDRDNPLYSLTAVERVFVGATWPLFAVWVVLKGFRNIRTIFKKLGEGMDK